MREATDGAEASATPGGADLLAAVQPKASPPAAEAAVRIADGGQTIAVVAPVD